MNICPHTGKVMYSQRDAGDVLRLAKMSRSNKIPRRAYRCKWCRCWHVTHLVVPPSKELRRLMEEE